LAATPRTDEAGATPVDTAAEEAAFRLHSLQQAHANQKHYDASDEELLSLYEQMLLIRRFEEKAGSSTASV
jgi:pyruvate dehydrogenase E1 component alpha subunit